MIRIINLREFGHKTIYFGMGQDEIVKSRRNEEVVFSFFAGFPSVGHFGAG